MSLSTKVSWNVIWITLPLRVICMLHGFDIIDIIFEKLIFHMWYILNYYKIYSRNIYWDPILSKAVWWEFSLNQIIQLTRTLHSSFFFFFFLRAIAMAYGSFQARSQIRPVAAATPWQQQLGIPAASATYSTAHGNAGSLAHLSKARDQTCIFMDTSWIHFCWAMIRTPFHFFFFWLFVFLGSHLWHMEFPRLGIQSEL